MSADSPGVVLRDALLSPDLVVPAEGPPEALRLAGSTFVGLAGAALFLAVTALDGRGGGVDPVALAAVPPLATLLAFPPLYLLTSVRGRSPGLMALLAVAVAGPSIAGTTLGASAPLLLLYGLTGEIDHAFRLLSVLLAMGAVVFGAVGGLKNARRAGPDGPGPVIVLGHYLFTLWTAAALAGHLA